MPDPLCLPFEGWPATDRRLWLAGTTPVALFDDPSAGAEWSPRSRAKAEQGYGRWLAWLRINGALEPTTAPGDRVTRERVADYLAALAPSCAPYTRVCRIQELYDALRVLSPESDWVWLRRVLARSSAAAEPSVNKRSRLRSTRELVELGQNLMAEADASSEMPGKNRALLYRDGLMISLLIARPLRVSTFATIKIGQHLVRQGDSYWLLFKPMEIKSRRPYENRIPEDLIEPLGRYLAIYRPLLLQRADTREATGSNVLWISKRGTPLAERSVANPVCKRTRQAFGSSLPPHWFRHASATSLAIEAPAHVRDAQHILDHASFSTTERHYNQARSLEASRRFHGAMASLKKSFRAGTPAGEPPCEP